MGAMTSKTVCTRGYTVTPRYRPVVLGQIFQALQLGGLHPGAQSSCAAGYQQCSTTVATSTAAAWSAPPPIPLC
jgi:hypothetical protein